MAAISGGGDRAHVQSTMKCHALDWLSRWPVQRQARGWRAAHFCIARPLQRRACSDHGHNHSLAIGTRKPVPWRCVHAAKLATVLIQLLEQEGRLREDALLRAREVPRRSAIRCWGLEALVVARFVHVIGAGYVAIVPWGCTNFRIHLIAPSQQRSWQKAVFKPGTNSWISNPSAEGGVLTHQACKSTVSRDDGLPLARVFARAKDLVEEGDPQCRHAPSRERVV